MPTMKFVVTECLGYGDGGDIEVEVDVTEEEIEEMKQLVRDNEEEFFDSIEGLYERIKQACRDEDPIWEDDEDSEEEDYDDTYYRVEIPQEIYDAVEAEPEEDETK